MANAINVRSAAKNETSEAASVIVTCWEKDNSRATKVTAVAKRRTDEVRSSARG